MYPGLLVCSITVAVNAVLNHVLINGWGSFPGWGFKGSPIATSVSSWLMLLMLLAYLGATRVHKRSCLLQPWDRHTFTSYRVRRGSASALASCLARLLNRVATCCHPFVCVGFSPWRDSRWWTAVRVRV